MMMVKRWTEISCLAFHEAGLSTGECCSSCHQDDEEGYAYLGEAYPARRNGRESRVFATLCCGVRRSRLPFTRNEFAAALRAYRRWLDRVD